MLRIEGTDGTIPEENIQGNTTTNPQSSSGAGGASGKSTTTASESQQRRWDSSGDVAGMDMQALMESFDAKMNMLRKVIEAGGSTLSGGVVGEIPEQQEGTE